MKIFELHLTSSHNIGVLLDYTLLAVLVTIVLLLLINLVWFGNTHSDRPLGCLVCSLQKKCQQARCPAELSSDRQSTCFAFISALCAYCVTFLIYTGLEPGKRGKGASSLQGLPIHCTRG